MFYKYSSSFLPKNQFHSMIGIWPNWVGWLAAQKNYECKPRVLDDYFIIYVGDGKGKFKCKGREYLLKKGAFFFLFPDIIHSYITDPESLLELWWVGFNGPNVKLLLQEAGISPNRPIIHFTQAAQPFSYVKKIVEEVSSCSISTIFLTSGLLYQLFALFIDNNKKTDETIYSSYSTHKDKPIERALAFMESNYRHQITVQQIAESVGLSRTRFSVKFREETGCSPLEHLNKLRLKQAKYYLLYSDLAIKHIAYSIGFQDPQYFSRFFSKKTGLSPKNFRQTLQEIKIKDKKASKTCI